MSIRAVIWDLGGVLVRTEDRAPRSRLAERLGMTYDELAELVFEGTSGRQAAIGKMPASRHWENMCAQLNLPVAEAATLQREFFSGDIVDTALVDFIRLLRPRYRTALLSNAWSDLRAAVQHEWLIADAFDEIIISAEVGVMKPDARIYRLAVERLGVAPAEAVFIDDFPANVEGARAAGLQAIHFANSRQAVQDLERLLESQE